MLAAFGATAPVACSGAISKEDFIAAADDLCREADERIAEIRSPRMEEEILGYVRQAEEIAGDLVSSLRAIHPPEEGREDVERMIDRLESATDLLGPLVEATIDRDVRELQDLQQEVERVTDEANELADSYGFEVCGAKVLDPVR